MEPAYGIKHVNVLETILRRARRLVETSRCIGRQSDDDGQNKLVQINYCKESLSYIINRMI